MCLPLLAAAVLGAFALRLARWLRPAPDAASNAAAVAVCVLAVLAVRTALRRVSATLAARRLCAQLGGGPGDLVVLDDAELSRTPA